MTDGNIGGPGGEGLRSQSDASPADIMSMYNAWGASGNYDRDVEGWGYDIPERLTALLVDDVATPHRVLDAGCGTGLGGVSLRAAGVGTIIGGDFSESSLATARARNVYDDVILLDLNGHLNFPTANFDAALCAGVFSYILDGAGALHELLRVVKPDGLVAFSQRADLWQSRSFGVLIDRLVAEGVCTANVSQPVPYLPGHPDFDDVDGVILTQLRRTQVPISPRVS